jgi:hypothetical protein
MFEKEIIVTIFKQGKIIFPLYSNNLSCDNDADFYVW